MNDPAKQVTPIWRCYVWIDVWSQFSYPHNLHIYSPIGGGAVPARPLIEFPFCGPWQNASRMAGSPEPGQWPMSNDWVGGRGWGWWQQTNKISQSALDRKVCLNFELNGRRSFPVRSGRQGWVIGSDWSSSRSCDCHKRVTQMAIWLAIQNSFNFASEASVKMDTCNPTENQSSCNFLSSY